jgi:hypothetical protein
MKDEARKHPSHAILFYAGYENDPLEQYVALTTVATILGRFDAFLVLNESALASFPSEALLAEEPGVDRLEVLRTLPIPLLYGGFLKLEVEGLEGVWMRTVANHLMNLPDFAILTPGHHLGNDTFEMFAGLLNYLRETKANFAPNDTITIENGVGLLIRSPKDTEHFLESSGTMLVLEVMEE